MSYKIVVGVDGSDASERALRWAATEAHARGGAVEAVIAWHWDGSGTFFIAATSPAEERDRAQQILDETVAKVTAQFPDVVLVGHVVEAAAAKALAYAAASADVMVLGSHGHNRLHHAVLGSVSEECVRRATCPVVVIPATQPQNVAQPQDAMTPVPATAALAN
jgi:nucleotide-binding universal stress UspA family protein